ncbi:MAG: PASTA domain-containing protein [Clostridia bacterium]|nr:PASTA domain-containing protein [Clostridia bacterium]
MDELILRCACCMHEKQEPGPCKRCGAQTDPLQDPACLPMHSILADRYYIGMPIQRNGESNVYLAYDNDYDCVCLVREFYPPTLAKRSVEDQSVLPMTDCESQFNTYRSEFTSLWKRIQKLKGLPGLVMITDVFDFNGTSYAVTPNSDDITLREMLKRQPESRITWEQARIMFIPLFSTLATLHSTGILHRGLSPETIHVDRNGRLRMSDFAVADLRIAKTELDTELFDGYCALEQYTPGKAIGPWTDVYAFCAVLYRSLTGHIPVAAPFRAIEDTMAIPSNIAGSLPEYAINAIIDGMEIYSLERVQNMDELRKLIAAPTEYIPRRQITEDETYYPTDADLGQDGQADLPIEEAPAEDTQEPVLTDALSDDSADEETIQWGSEDGEEDAEQEEDEKKKKSNLDKAITALLIVILAITLVGLGFVGKYLASFIQGDPVIQNPAQQETTVVVPNCLGLTMEEIENTPDIMNNFTVRFVMVTGSSRAYGQIDRQSLNFGDSVAIGSELMLSVSALPMPDVTGQPIIQAQAALDSYGLTYFVEYKTYSDGDKTKSGSVAYTTPGSMTAVVPGENRMYAKDGQYYDVLITVWYYGVVSSEVVTGNNSSPTDAFNNNINIDLNFGNDSVG